MWTKSLLKAGWAALGRVRRQGEFAVAGQFEAPDRKSMVGESETSHLDVGLGRNAYGGYRFDVVDPADKLGPIGGEVAGEGSDVSGQRLMSGRPYVPLIGDRECRNRYPSDPGWYRRSKRSDRIDASG